MTKVILILYFSIFSIELFYQKVLIAIIFRETEKKGSQNIET